MEMAKKETEDGPVVDGEIPPKYTYKDLPAVITKVLHPLGRYQLALFFALNLNGIIYGSSHTLTAFHIYTPKFFCLENDNVPNSCKNFNGTCPSGFVFEDDDHTIVTEWSLVCSRRLLAPMVNTLYFCGVTVGALVCGYLSDKFGRKKVLMLCLFSQGILGLLLRTTSILELFIVMRTIQGFFVQGLQGCCLAIFLEYCPPRLRNIASVGWYTNFTLGLVVLGCISYEVRDWRMLQVMISIPTFIIACYIWAIPESIAWLYATNQKRQAVKMCIKTARLNGDHKLSDEIKTKFSDQLNKKSTEEVDETVGGTEKVGVLDIWRTLCLRKHLFVMITVNYASLMSYYGTVYFLNNLSGSRHLNFVISACVELVSYPIVYILLRNFGSRFTVILYLYSTAFLCAAIGIIHVYMPETNEHRDIIIATFSLIAKGCAISSFTAVSLYNAELFPTICRGTAFGILGLSARTGSISAPFLMILYELKNSALIPMSILATALFVTGSLSFMLPDTQNKPLTNTIADAKDMWEKKIND